jgi:hypothetical protein
MMRLDSGDMPHLIVLRPGSDRGRRIPLYRDYLVAGREQTCDVQFDDPRVSRRLQSIAGIGVLNGG